ncbi:uncharacterized protein K02A2.6 [Trichonephila clavata]|uniref:Uncharacterized protein K02A2.6 n=1 Tax=Trichonephila clavata TaxID=2740835 RepID=A0A8X6G2H0_TRICU|nr:uncharacterized protein K02A2.6 [Trichonephila clavata]
MHKYEGTIQQKLSTFLMQYQKAPNPNVTTTHSPAMLFLKRDIRTRINLLLPELKTKIQNKLRRDNFEFRDRKFDVGDRSGVPSTDVAVPDLSQSSVKETDSETRSPPVPDRPFPRRSGRIRRPPERLVL